MDFVRVFFFYCCLDHRDLHSFPTRRSSDLWQWSDLEMHPTRVLKLVIEGIAKISLRTRRATYYLDRKSTRLNSSHVKISYAVFCLKKKKKKMSVHIISIPSA